MPTNWTWAWFTKSGFSTTWRKLRTDKIVIMTGDLDNPFDVGDVSNYTGSTLATTDPCQ